MHIAKDDAEVQKWFKKYLAEGFEGAVIRNTDFTYKQSRICDVLKLKKEHEQEFKIIDAEKSKNDEVIWILEVPQADGRKTTVKSVMIAPHDERVQYYIDRKKYFGALATVQFMEWSTTTKKIKQNGKTIEITDVTPRHPRTKAIRWDL